MAIADTGFDKQENVTSKMWAPPAERESSSQACLLFLTGVEAGRVFGLDGKRSEQKIGRDDDCEIVVDSPEISRFHAQLKVLRNGRLEIADLGSLNGTFVNGRRITAEPLRRGDKVRLGPHFCFKVLYQDDEDFTYARQLYEQAHSDYLTGIPNRRHFNQLLEKEWKRARKYNHPLSLAMIDIDHFKAVNDTHGHNTGDQVLRQLVGRVKDLHEEDTLCRFGGEEFVLVMPETDNETAVERCRAIRSNVCAEPFVVEDQTIPVTISIGVGTANGDDFEIMIAERLLAIVDECLFLAKEQGRNRVVNEKVGASKFRWTNASDPTITIF